ncbi:MAG: tetratricopeptide repeat protein [Acidobacteriaceae bacterium]|nr:tetratricopeptide repeat protein [Acidobacteriaceae bacterium]
MAQMDANGNTAVASDELLHAIQLDGETPADTLLSAELAERSNALPQAEQAYLKVLSSDPDNVEARVGLGHVFKAENKLADAEAVLQKGLDKHPEDLQLTMQLATVLVAEQKTEQAIPLLEKLRAAAPQGVDLAALTDMLAHIYSANGNMEAAEKLYRQALLKTPDDPRELDALGSLLIREAKFAEAEDLLRRAANQRAAFNDDSAWGDSAGHLAFAASRNGHPQMVLQALAARASVLAETPGTLFLSATAYDSLHQYKDAVKQYKAFLAIAADKFPTEEFQARHRLIALERQK